MPSDTYRARVNALAVITSAAFFGANAFIGLLMGVYWLSLAPADFVAQFFPQFGNFLFTIMPLFLLMPGGLILSARRDRHLPAARRNWVIALWLYLAVTLITVLFHMPLNVRLAAAVGSPVGDALDFYKSIALTGPVTEENAATIRGLWLLGHIPASRSPSPPLSMCCARSPPHPHADRRKRCRDKGIFAQVMAGLAAGHRDEKNVMIDATYLETRRTATSMGVKRGARAPYRSDQGRNGHEAACDLRRQGTPAEPVCHCRAGQDDIGARVLLRSLPNVDRLLGERGHDADWFWEELEIRGIGACIADRKQRKTTVKYDKRRNRIDIMFGRLKDWRRLATRDDRCPKVFLSAIALAAIVI